MLEAIGERLLHDSVGGEVHAGRNLGPIAFDDDLHGETRFGHMRRETIELGEAWLWTRASSVPVGGAQHAQHAFHLGQGFAAG